MRLPNQEPPCGFYYKPANPESRALEIAYDPANDFIHSFNTY